MYCREKLMEIFETNGIFVIDNELQTPLAIDSITFITLIIDAENLFDIEIPENELIYNEEFSFMTMENIIEKIISSEGNMQ